MESKKAVLNDFPFVTTREEILHNKIAVCKIRNIRQVLIDKRTNVRYNYCIATLGKMLNRNSNKSVYGQFDFPFGWPLGIGGVKMQERLEVGSHVFIIESNRIITEVVVAARRGDFYTVRFLNGGAIQIRRSRIFTTRDEAEIKIPVRAEVNRRFHAPYDYGM